MMAPVWFQRFCAVAMERCIRRVPAGRVTARLGIFKADRVGDLILAQRAIEMLIQSVPADDAVLITSDVAIGAAGKLFPTVRTIAVTERGIVRGLPAIWRSARSLRGLRFGRLVCLQHHRAATQALLLRCLDADWSVGCGNARPPAWPGEGDVKFAATLPYPDSAADLPRELEAHRLVVRAALDRTFAPTEILPRISPPETSDRHLLVSPFASNPIRDYPAHHLVQAVLSAQTGNGMPVRILVSPADRARGRGLAAGMTSAGIRDVAAMETASFREYADAVGRARLVLTMETGTAHLATAMDKRTVVVMGGGHFGLLGPWQRSARQIWLANRVPCYGCDWRCTQPEVTCITGISPADVAAALRSLWAETS